MDKELEERISNFNEMFRSKGWRQLLTDLEENAQVINSIEAAKDAQDLFYRKGQLAVIAQMMNFEASINAIQEEYESADSE